MSSLDQLTDQQFELHALEVLRRELGVEGLARFLRLHRAHAGDYSRGRDQWQQGLTVDQIVESLPSAGQRQPGH